MTATLTIEQRRNPTDWRPLRAELSAVQRLVFDRSRMSYGREANALARQLYSDATKQYQETITQEIRAIGCTPPRTVRVSTETRQRLRRRAEQMARSIADTYNYHMTFAIQRIGKDVPTANRFVYSARLFGSARGSASTDPWSVTYWASKNPSIAATETMTTINRAKRDFTRRNRRRLKGTYEVRPYSSSGDAACERAIGGNPYNDLRSLPELPLHINCVHYAEFVPGPEHDPAKIDCSKLWG